MENAKDGLVTSKCPFIKNLKELVSNRNTNYLQKYDSGRGGRGYSVRRGGGGGYYGKKSNGNKGKDEYPAKPLKKKSETGTSNFHPS